MANPRISLEFVMSNGRVIATDPETARDSSPDDHVAAAALAELSPSFIEGELLTVTVAGRRTGVNPRHVVTVNVEVFRQSAGA